jgi:hypothetical protein
MTRIFIENNELDITQQFSQQITYAVDDLQNMDSKATSFTKTIVLPGTANNNRLLGNIFEFGNSNFTIDSQPNVGYNFNASKSANARIEIDGLPVMKGVLRLLEILIDGDYIEYEVALFGELGGFISNIGASKLTDLDFSEYNHTYNVTNIQASWNNQGSGYYYPLIDYGNTSPISNINFSKKNFYFTAFRPAFFVREYMDKIIRNAGYTWESDFMDTDYFKSLIIPNNQSRLKFNRGTIFESRLLGNYTLNDTLTHSSVYTDLFSNVGSEVFTYTSSTPFTGAMNISLRGTYTITNSDIAETQFKYAFATMSIYKNGSLFYQDQNKRFGGFATTLGISTPPSYSFNLRWFGVPITFALNNTFEIRLEVFDTDGAVINVTLSNSGMGITTENPVLVSAQYGDDLLVNGTLPANILQKDFFTSVLKMFNLMVTEDKYNEKHLILTPYVDFYDTDRATFLDYSDKVDRSQMIKIKPMSEINARYYTFKYKTDNDFYNEDYRKKYAESYGDRVFDNQLEFTKDTSNTEVVFSNSILVGYTDRDKVFPAIYKKTNDTEEMIEHNIRIMFTKKITGRIAWKIYNQFDIELVSGLTAYGYAGHLDNPFNSYNDLCFGVPKELYFNLTSGLLSRNLFNIFYSSYFAEIIDTNSRLVTCKIHFKPSDIFNLNFGKLIWIDGVLYRLNKVQDYSENELTSVELLRVNYLEYDAPYYEQYNLGDELNGGYIVYIDGSGRHGLIAPDYDDVEQLFAFNWGGAIAYCDAYTINGFSDWRIGTKDEMLAIDSNQAFIPNFVTNNFWTGTEYNSTQSYFVNMDGTGINFAFEDKTGDFFALPIKSF